MKHYAQIHPLVVHRFDSADQPGYQSLPITPIKCMSSKTTQVSNKEATVSNKDFTDISEDKDSSIEEERVTSNNSGAYIKTVRGGQHNNLLQSLFHEPTSDIYLTLMAEGRGIVV